MRAHTNNLPQTVLVLLKDAAAEYGMPSRVRADRGGENIALATYMVLKNGPGRASIMWGSYVCCIPLSNHFTNGIWLF